MEFVPSRFAPRPQSRPERCHKEHAKQHGTDTHYESRFPILGGFNGCRVFTVCDFYYILQIL